MEMGGVLQCLPPLLAMPLSMHNFLFRWEHVFVLKDYTTKDLDISYVMLVVIGKKNDKSEVIGRTVLAGKYGENVIVHTLKLEKHIVGSKGEIWS